MKANDKYTKTEDRRIVLLNFLIKKVVAILPLIDILKTYG